MLSVDNCDPSPKMSPSVKVLDLNFIIIVTVAKKLVNKFIFTYIRKLYYTFDYYIPLAPRLFPRLKKHKKRFKANKVRETQKLEHISEKSQNKNRNESYNIVYNTASP
ncbi:hypothetical protein PCYB_001280 [Plasmodium cynomolgi strain B]|uniref:Uncharacterized protein n=1 Tax=Plasmodium cynomolgi (strain B) TaxID=1120755 RepID=K6V2A6_PLACD|nr:hypothetical protein PCYB_001280 [Plasmodium cynomolgi strain B]GAB69380.1 hypothetical protein PCYB_001280 [Plasmodium cynomolgi strain B]